VREVAEEAGVNLGMFHYHFKTRDAFLRELLQSVYEDMFSQLQVQRDDAWTPVDNLRAALRFLGRFLRANRPILSRVLADALCGDPIAIDFLKRNAPAAPGAPPGARRARAEGRQPRAHARAPGGRVLRGKPRHAIIFGGAAVDSGALPPPAARMVEGTLLSDAAIDARIDLALAAIAREARGKKKNERTRR
jgi:AcrR family transcriptional regulator